MAQGFSRAGLIKQLTSPYGNKFTQADATWAADHAGANWDDQAVTAAKGYMADGQGFSREGLIQQLTSPYGNQFTHAQAEYAASKVGL
jgi:Host cell surface-exposed lipoprotein